MGDAPGRFLKIDEIVLIGRGRDMSRLGGEVGRMLDNALVFIDVKDPLLRGSGKRTPPLAYAHYTTKHESLLVTPREGCSIIGVTLLGRDSKPLHNVLRGNYGYVIKGDENDWYIRAEHSADEPSLKNIR